MKCWKTWLFATIISTVAIIVFMRSTPSSLNGSNLEKLNSKIDQEKTSSMKTILIWTKFWADPRKAWEKIFYLLINKKCPVNNCNIVFRNYHQIRNVEENADAILFHASDLYKIELPRKHRSNQPWIAFSLEAPPVMTGGKKANHLKKLRNVFNWTMSYRRNSDIVVPYGQFIPRKEPLEVDGKNIWKEKVGDGSIGTWMVSHCKTESGREWYMKELQKFIDVDIYGKCSNLTCGSKLSILSVKQSNLDKCNKILRSHYFYFALENSICNDYVTEKFYLALTLDVIPVVFGGADYESIAPSHSYINALEFKTPKELAKYLTKLAKDESAYNKYFEWKRHFTVQLGHPFTPLICDLCSILHEQPPTAFYIRYPWYLEGSMPQSEHSLQLSYNRKVTDSYEDIHSWLIDGSECKSWNSTTKGLQKYEIGIPVNNEGKNRK